jgi:PAS domain S-box-containing protein
MKLILSPYVLIMLAAAIICMFIAVYVWLCHRKNSETIPLILLLAGIAEWIVAALMGLVDQDLTHKIIWAKIEYIGVVSVPLAVLGYVLQHSGSNQKLNIKRLAWLAVIPVATLVLAWTNGNHGLIWAKYIPYQENGLVLSDKTYGPGFWVYWAYSYLVLLAATVITFRLTLVPAKIFRWQSILVLIGILAPWIGNLLYVLHLDPFKNIDLTPLGFSITGILLAIGMFQWQLFDIKPIAQAAVLKGMADGMLILDNQERIVEVNPAAQDILGLGVQELVGKQMEQVIANLLPPDEPSRQKREKALEIKLTNGKEDRIYELSDSPFYEEHGTPGGRIIFLHDVTDRKQLEERLKETEQKLAEEALRESEDKFKYFFDYSPVGTSLTLPTGEINVNQAFCDMLGYNLPEFKNKKWQEITHPEDIELTQREVDQLLSGKRDSVRFIKRFIHKDGSVVWGDISTSMRRDADGKPLHLMTSVNDITERKKADQDLLQSRRAALNMMTDAVEARDRAEQMSKALKSSEVFNQALIANSPIGISVRSHTGDLLSSNAAWRNIWALPEEEYQGMLKEKSDELRFDERDVILLPYQEQVRQVYEQGGSLTLPDLKTLYFRPGNAEWVSQYSYAIMDDQGQVDRVVTLTEDITERTRAEEEIRHLNAELEQRVIKRTVQLEAANKELEAFSYSVSHDLRAPLRGIDGWSLALLEDYGSQLDGQAKTYLERVRSETQRMGQLIDDLLQLSRLASTEISLRQVDLSAMAWTLAASLHKSQPERQVEFVIQPGLNANGDPRLLEIALTNLLGNAFKFTGKTPQARIQFGQTQVEGQPAFFVRDNGAGFDMALAKKLFGAFQRMHKASDFPGTGVGLTTVQRIVHRHGGRIWAEAAVDQGATFYFTIEEIP